MHSLLLDVMFGHNSRGIIIFGFEIYYYAICIVLGMILAAGLSALLMKRRNMSPEFIFSLFVICIPTAIICARLFYCITDDTTSIADFFSFRDGGLSVIGGVIGGVAAGYGVCRFRKVNFFRAADCVVVTILVAQALGRWGNFFNQEVYGQMVKDPALQWFPLAVQVGSNWYYALFFYESMINLVGFGLLFSAAWFFKLKPNGLLTFSYFLWYGIVRTVMEPLRDSNYQLGIWSWLFAILMIVFGIAGIVTLLILNWRKEGAFIGSKKGDPCGITQYLSADKNEKPYYSKINLLGANYPPRPYEETRKGKRELKAKQKAAGSAEAQDSPAEDSDKPSDDQDGEGL